MGRILIFGAGWLGHKFQEYLGAEVSAADITDGRQVAGALERVKPGTVINAAGKTGKPNIDWCETHRQETVASNVTGPLVLLKECLPRNIRLVHLSSGCIFNGPAPRPEGFSEEDEPRPASFYAWTKARAEEVLREFPVLILRLRMPIDGIPNPRNLITKLAGYPEIVDVENSLTAVEDLLFAAKRLIAEDAVGIFNVVNPGAVRHPEIMDRYRAMVDPGHAYRVISTEELYRKGMVKTGRSNCILDTRKLARAGVVLRPVSERIEECLKIYKTYWSDKSD